jgi:hypothetical protein
MGGYSAHETLQVASVLMDYYGSHVCEHSWVGANPEELI